MSKNKIARDQRIKIAIRANRGKWLTSRELFEFIVNEWPLHGISSHKSLASIIRRFKLISRKRYPGSTKSMRNSYKYETEYYCDKLPKANPFK